MRIRIRQNRGGNVAQLIRERYDPERGRGRQEVLGTLPVDAAALPIWLTGPGTPLSSSELAQLRAWHAERLSARKAAALAALPDQLAAQATALAAAIEEGQGVPVEQREVILATLDRLMSALRKQSCPGRASDSA